VKETFQLYVIVELWHRILKPSKLANKSKKVYKCVLAIANFTKMKKVMSEH